MDYSKKLKDAGVANVVEKPAVAPAINSEVDSMQEVITDENKTFATDAFPYVNAMRALEANPNLVKDLGKLKAIHGTCIEPGNIEEGRGWLINQLKAGGGVAIADTMPHPASWVNYTLNWYLDTIAHVEDKVDLASADIQDIDTYRISDEDLLKVMTPDELKEANEINPDTETFGAINAKLKMPDLAVRRELVDPELEIKIAGGKGVGGRPGAFGNQEHDKPSLALELVFEYGRVELSTGYMVEDKVTYDSYIARVPAEMDLPGHPIEVYKIPGNGFGYNNMLVDWLLAAKGEITERLKAVSESAKNSMKLLNKAFNKIKTDGIKPIQYKLKDIVNPGKAGLVFGWVNPLVDSQDHDFTKKNF